MGFRLAAVAAITSALVLAQGPADLDRAWARAITQKDAAALDRLLADDLIYAHSSGVVDTKQTYIEKIRSGKQVYRTLDQRKLSVRAHGDTVVTHSWVHVTGVNPKGPFDDKVMMLHVWIKTPAGWRLVGHQTTLVADMP